MKLDSEIPTSEEHNEMPSKKQHGGKSLRGLWPFPDIYFSKLKTFIEYWQWQGPEATSS